MINMDKLILCFLSCILLSSCIFDRDADVNRLFSEIEDNSMNPYIIAKITLSSEDSLFNHFPVFLMEYNAASKRLKCEEEVQSFFDNLNIEKDIYVRECLTLYSFQKFLKHQKFDWQELEVAVKYRMDRRRQSLLDEDKQIISIIQENIIHNDTKWKVGDTLNLLMRSDNFGSQSHIFYTSFRISKNGKAIDLHNVLIRGVLHAKKYGQDTWDECLPNNKFGIVFIVKITDLGDSAVFLSGERLYEGDELYLPLWLYQLRIE